eukprot:g3805.t1
MSVFHGTIIDKTIPITNRRIKRGHRYDYVKATTDTGASANKVQSISQKEFLKRRDELFQRIKGHKLAQLIQDFTSVGPIGLSRDGMIGPTAELLYGEEHQQNTETWQERPTQTKWQKQEEDEQRGKNFIILDVRTESEYRQCHIIGSHYFPSSWLRADKTGSLYKYRSRRDFLIVLYEEEEKLAQRSATNLVQKGWENVAILTNGLKNFVKQFPAFVNGELPNRRIVPLSAYERNFLREKQFARAAWNYGEERNVKEGGESGGGGGGGGDDGNISPLSHKVSVAHSNIRDRFKDFEDFDQMNQEAAWSPSRSLCTSPMRRYLQQRIDAGEREKRAMRSVGQQVISGQMEGRGAGGWVANRGSNANRGVGMTKRGGGGLITNRGRGGMKNRFRSGDGQSVVRSRMSTTSLWDAKDALPAMINRRRDHIPRNSQGSIPFR